MNDNIKAGADINAGDGGYSLGTQEKYDEFVKGRNQSLGKMRIKTLMREAGTDTSGKWMGIEHAEKFAELIVKECIEVVGRATASPNGYQALMKHFGVEE
jgi:hypothetical protein